ncbi:MAG: hypothetical protein ACKVHE_18925 [Planctomycetales bacterium]
MSNLSPATQTLTVLTSGMDTRPRNRVAQVSSSDSWHGAAIAGPHKSSDDAHRNSPLLPVLVIDRYAPAFVCKPQ